MEEEVINMKWYVLRVMGGKENKTVTFIEKEIDRLGLQDFVSQILVPTEKVYQIKNGKKVKKMVLEFILPLANNIVMKVNGNMT